MFNDPLVVVVTILVVVLIVFIGVIVLRPSTVIKDAETISQISSAMLVRLQQQLDISAARSRIDGENIASLSRQLIELGKKPITLEQAAQRANVPLEVFNTESHKGLRDVLVSSFDLTEIDLLATDIGIDSQEVKGVTKTERAASLIEFARHRKLLDKLVGEIKTLRPSAVVNGK